MKNRKCSKCGARNASVHKPGRVLIEHTGIKKDLCHTCRFDALWRIPQEQPIGPSPRLQSQNQSAAGH